MTLAKSDIDALQELGGVYRHPKIHNVAYTAGIKFMADEAGAHWLVNEIAVAQRLQHMTDEQFQVWKLDVFRNNQALLTCYNEKASTIYRKRIDYTDFPFDEVSIFCVRAIIMLPREYLE
jgi:uncharacterized membrane protein